MQCIAMGKAFPGGRKYAIIIIMPGINDPEIIWKTLERFGKLLKTNLKLFYSLLEDYCSLDTVNRTAKHDTYSCLLNGEKVQDKWQSYKIQRILRFG